MTNEQIAPDPSGSTPDASPRRESKWAEWWKEWSTVQKRTILGVAILAVLGIAGTITATLVAVRHYDDWAFVVDEREELSNTVGQLEDALADAEDALVPQGELARRENAVVRAEQALQSREDEVVKRETDVSAAGVAVDGREAAVKAREDAVAANVNAGDWWVGQVRECLARPGSYRMASATEGSLGRDVSCMSG